MATSDIETLNAEAAACFSSTSFLDASKRWCHLLRLLLPHLQVLSASFEESDAPLPCGVSNIALQFVHVQQPETVEDDDRMFAAFRYGILYTSSAGSAWGAREYRKVAVATCYNMSLSHHLHGLRDANNAASLDKALKGYRLARSLLESIVTDVTAESQDIVLLALAIANNEGHVLAARYDTAGAHECWLDLHWLLMHADPTPHTYHFFETAATFQGNDKGIFSLHAPVA
jgi:hypothetical protein